MKKKNILYYLLVIFPFLIAIGFSTWVIIYEFNFSPNKQESNLSSFFGTEQEAIFNNEELFPIQINGDKINPSSISYFYKEYGADDSTYDSGGPIDSGTYNVKIIVAGENGAIPEECVIKFTVKPKKLYTNTIEMNYSSTEGNYTDFTFNKQNYIKFYSEDGSVDKLLYPSAYQISAMHNGYYYYGDLESIDDYDTSLLVEPSVPDVLIGSTYLIKLKVIDDNFLIKDCISNEYTLTPRIMFKYKTVYATINGIANTLVTIEDAITNSSSDVVLMGIDSDDNNFIEKSFSKILPTNTYSLSGKRKLKLLYATNSGDFDRNYRSKITGLYSCLMIPNGITINLEENSESQIIIGAMLVPNGSVARHSVIINHGEINVNSSCFVGAYGFLKGTGLINVKSGGEVMDVFKIYDWPGADEALSLTKANAFPVKEWSVCNISCRTRIYNGGLYNSVSNILVLSIVELKIDDIFIIGTSETDNCLFKPGASSSSLDYIEKSAYIPNDSYTATNQSKTIQNSVYVKGNYIDDNVKVNARGYPFETSTSCAIPLSYYDITIMDDSKLEISAASYIFMNSSSKISVMENAEIQINGNAYIAMLNGSAVNMKKQGSTLSGVGTFAGKINCNAERSVLSISNYDILKDENRIILKTSSTASASYECLSSGNIKVNNEYKTEQSFEDSFLYISEEKNGTFYYAGASEDEYTSYKIIYHTNGGETLSNDIIPSFDSTYEVTKSMLKKPYKKYYSLKNWHTSESFTEENIFNSIILDSSNSTLNIYAEWEYKKYEFVYVVAYENPETNEPIILHLFPATRCNVMR